MDLLCDTPWRSVGTFRILTNVDEHRRECVASEADTSLPGLCVIEVVEQLALTRGLPEEIHVDHGPESSLVLGALGPKSIECRCATLNRARLFRMPTSKSFNGRFRDDLPRARKLIEGWYHEDNGVRPLRYKTPNEFAARIAQQQPQPLVMSCCFIGRGTSTLRNLRLIVDSGL